MSYEQINRIKAYLIRCDLQAEEDLRAAEQSYRVTPCSFTAARLLAAQNHNNSIHKILLLLRTNILSNRIQQHIRK